MLVSTSNALTDARVSVRMPARATVALLLAAEAIQSSGRPSWSALRQPVPTLTRPSLLLLKRRDGTQWGNWQRAFCWHIVVVVGGDIVFAQADVIVRFQLANEFEWCQNVQLTSFFLFILFYSR